MKKKLLTVFVAGLLLCGVSNAQTTLYGITTDNAIFLMNNVNTPGSINGPYSVSGVATGQVLVGLDVRAGNGMLYALGYDSLMNMAELYTLAPSGTTYTATAVSGTLASMNLGLTNSAALDFMSTADNQIRVIGRNGNSYVMNANTGTIMSTGSGTIAFGAGDLYTGANVLAATAYTNNFYGADATQEVGYDAVNNVLVTFDAGNYANGFSNISTTIHSIGTSVGAVLLGTGSIGMDSWYDSSTHNNIVFLTGSTLVAGAHLYKYDLSTVSGTLTDLGAIGSGALQVRDIAFAGTRDTTVAVTGRMMTALSLNMRNLLFFDAAHPDNIRKVLPLTGMGAGQTMVGIDYAANSGTLYGLGYNSAAQTYQLYTIDSATGNLTAVNSTPGSLNLGTDDGSGNTINAGFRFVSTAANRIRVTGNNGATNVELDATAGAVAATNTGLQYVTGDASFGATANLTSIAYTGFNGDTATQMFGFDANTGSLVMFSATNTAAGLGDGTSGYISTGLNLNTTLNLLLHNSLYNNAHLNIIYDQPTNANVGFMAANYIGDSSAQLNYSLLYDMSDMLTGYHKGTSSAPVPMGKLGYGIPVKDVTATRYYAPPITGVTSVSGNDDLFVYPNPAVSTARIMLPVASEGIVSVFIVDMGGNIIRTYKYEPRSYQLDVDMSTLPMGVYSIRVSGKGVGEHSLQVEKGQ